MKKNVGRKNWEYIGIYNPAAKWLRPFCTYTLTEIERGYRRECYINLFIYLILFIPFHLLEALYCMWDGGLKEFTIEGRYIGGDDLIDFHDGTGAYPKAKEVWERT